MMDANQFQKLSEDLRTLACRIPLNWGAVQNNRYDSMLNMFQIDSYEQLEAAIAGFSPEIQDYFRRRWYIWQCSKCDEYLFTLNPNVTPNPNPKDKSYDIKFDGQVRFDLKGTVIPKSMRAGAAGCIADPQAMVDFYYDKQSGGVRYGLQNRLFVVHHSFVDPDRELLLRSDWDVKKEIYRIFAENFSRINFRQSHGCKAAVIFILERQPGQIEFKIDGLDPIP